MGEWERINNHHRNVTGLTESTDVKFKAKAENTDTQSQKLRSIFLGKGTGAYKKVMI